MSKKIHPGQLSLQLVVGTRPSVTVESPTPPKGGGEKHSFTERMLTAVLQEVRAMRKELRGKAA